MTTLANITHLTQMGNLSVKKTRTPVFHQYYIMFQVHTNMVHPTMFQIMKTVSI